MSLPAPVIQLPSPFRSPRDSRYAIRGDVSHRIAGWLLGARAAFGVRPGTPRNASTHFGIGHEAKDSAGNVRALCPECGPITGARGPLVIDQYVDLADMAWGNGDVRDPTWTRLVPGVNPNLYTVSTEHEDGGLEGRGVVTDHVWRASVALKRLLYGGDLAAIRRAGIVVSDRPNRTAAQLVSELARVPKDATGFVDHHAIAGPNKPYCWRAWRADEGFVPARLAQLLEAFTEDDMIQLRRKAEPWTFRPGAKVYAAPSLAAPVMATLAGGPGVTVAEEAEYAADGSLVNTGVWRQLVLQGDRLGWVHRSTMDPIRQGMPQFDDLVRSVLFETDLDHVPAYPPPGQADLARLQEALDAANRRTGDVKALGVEALKAIASQARIVGSNAEKKAAELAAK